MLKTQYSLSPSKCAPIINFPFLSIVPPHCQLYRHKIIICFDLPNYSTTKAFRFQFFYWNNGYLHMFFYFSYYCHYFNSNPCCNMPEFIKSSPKYFLFFHIHIQSFQVFCLFVCFTFIWPCHFLAHKASRTLYWTKWKFFAMQLCPCIFWPQPTALCSHIY